MNRRSLLLVPSLVAVVLSLALPAWSAASSYDDPVGYPKIALFRSAGSADQLAKYDWVVEDGSPGGLADLDKAKQSNPNLLELISPYGGVSYKDVIMATYGYSKISAPISSPWGTLRAKQTNDDVLDPSGSPHQYGSVTVLNLQQYGSSDSTAIWSARVRAKYYLDNVAGHPGIQGIWGDNDFWSDQGYAWSGAHVDARLWNNGFIAAHQELARLLPAGSIIGGNDLSSMADHPSSYQGDVPNGWQLLNGLGRAGMKEGANHYYGLTDASGLDGLITGIRSFLALKQLDGLQRYEMINVSEVSPDSATARLGLAASCISGAYFWGYGGSGGDFASALSFWMPQFDQNGRHWLGRPTADPVQLASGVWSRTFEHGTVVANASGSSRTVAGVTVPNDDGAFIAGNNGSAPPPPSTPGPAPQTTPAPAPQSQPSSTPAPSASSAPSSAPTGKGTSGSASSGSTAAAAASVGHELGVEAAAQEQGSAAGAAVASASVNVGWDGVQFSSRDALRSHVTARGVVWEAFLRLHPALTKALGLPGVQWDGTRIYSAGGMRSWLTGRGASYTRWVKLHPEAVRLLDPAPARGGA